MRVAHSERTRNAEMSLTVSKKGIQSRNKKALRRIDSHVEDVVLALGHVVIYSMNSGVVPSQKLWSRHEVEGAFFVVKRSNSPEHRIVVINRLSTTNLVEDIDDSFRFELNGPFLLFGNSCGIKGAWFSSPKEKDSLFNTLKKIAPAALCVANGAPPKSPPRQLLTPAQVQRGSARDSSAYEIGKLLLATPTTGAAASMPMPLSARKVATISAPDAPALHDARDPQNIVLTKTQLQNVLLRMIKNESFIDILHREYLASVQGK